MRGSMLVFLSLTATSSFTSLARTCLLLVITIYFYEANEVLSGFCFFAGVLLADLSLVLKNSESSHFISSVRSRKKWPVALTVISLFLASFPPENFDRAAYSRFVEKIFQRYITVSGGTCPVLHY
jgi:hypothetical protein